MEKNESIIIDMISNPAYNTKTNNYIIEGMENSTIDSVFRQIPPIAFPQNTDRLDIVTFPQEVAILPIDFSKDSFAEKRINSVRDVYKVIISLENRQKAFEIILRNCGLLSELEQQIVNTFLFENSYFLSFYLFLDREESLKTYQTMNGKTLDYRESYTRIRTKEKWIECD